MWRSKYIKITGIVIWIGVVYSGYAAFIDHGYETPKAGPLPNKCPSILASQLGGVPTAFLFAHPQCPCTRASLYNLRDVVSAAGTRLRVVAYFYSPPGKPDDWVESDTWRLARDIPGAVVLRDADGEHARACRAAASGTVMVYGPDGTLLFSGGLTSSRGHEGQSTGADALAAIARGQAPAVHSMPAFGCLIFAEDGQ